MDSKLRIRRKELRLSLEEVGNIVGVGKSTVRKWETGDIANMGRDKIALLSKALQVAPSFIIDATAESNQVLIPILGIIAAGIPILAQQYIESYIQLPLDWHIDFALRVKGDSMIDLGIEDGSIALCKRQEEFENGQIAVCLIDDEEATLKRVYDDGSVLSLVAANSKYQPRIFKGSQRKQVHIQGICKKVIKDVY